MVEVDAIVAVAVGYRIRGGLEVENAGTLKTSVLGEMPLSKQEKLLDESMVTNLDAAEAEVLKGLKERSNAATEAHLQTAQQATALHEVTNPEGQRRGQEAACRRLGLSPHQVHAVRVGPQ